MDSCLCGCCLAGEYGKDKISDGKRGAPHTYEPDFKGPIKSRARRPRDLLCLALFILYIVGLLAVGFFALSSGQPKRIVYPTDSKGRLCGVDKAVQDRPFLLFFELAKCAQIAKVSELIKGEFNLAALFTCPTQQVCVSECPKTNEFGVRNNPVCVDSVDTTSFRNLTSVDLTDITAIAESSEAVATLLELIKLEKCAPYYIASQPIARRCLPRFLDLPENSQNLRFNSSSSLLALANMSRDFSLKEVFLNISVRSIVDGVFTEGLLTASMQFLALVYEDFVIVWPALLLGLCLTMVVALSYILLLKWMTGTLILVGIGFSVALITAITIFSYYQFYCFQEMTKLFSKFDATINNTILDFLNSTKVQLLSHRICLKTSPLRDFIDAKLPWFQYQQYTWLATGIVGTLLVLIIIILVVVLAKKILISIEIIREATKAVAAVPTSIAYPLVTFSLLLTVLIYWAVVAVFLFTASVPTFAVMINDAVMEEPNITEYDAGVVTNGTSCDPLVFKDTVFRKNPFTSLNTTISCHFKEFFTSNFIIALQFYHLFGLFWLTNFILALGQCTLAGGFASWYWAFRKPKDVPTFALVRAFGRTLLFHSGSLAFGSLLIAFVQMLRVILFYIQKKLKGKKGKVAQALLCLLGACLWLFEKVLQYISKLAYVEIAIYGDDFCTASCNVIRLLLRNIVITAIKDRIVGFLLLFGKLVITGVVACAAYAVFAGYIDGSEYLWKQPLNYYLSPVIFLIVSAFLIASGFLSVYHMAVDTVFICAMEDFERNNGADKPYFMSKKLMRLLSVKNNNDEVEMSADKRYLVQARDSLETLQR